MSAFIRMYEPHEAREDMVVFPVLRDVVPAKQFRDLADISKTRSTAGSARRLPRGGRQSRRYQKSLGIYDLSQFTAS